MVDGGLRGQDILQAALDWLSSPCKLELTLTEKALASSNACLEDNIARAMRINMSLQQGAAIQPDFISYVLPK